MTTVGLTFKRVFNEAHNNLQNTVLPLGAPSASAFPSSLNMPPARKNTFVDDVKTFLEHFKHVVILPLSWWLTIWQFVFFLTWTLMTLPLRFAIGFYEREVRRQYPWLPSIYGTMNKLFPKGINLPSITALTAGPYKGEGPTGPDLPALDDSALLDSIMNGTGPGDLDSSPQNGGGSKLESSLNKIPNSSQGNLDGALGDVKSGRTGRN